MKTNLTPKVKVELMLKVYREKLEKSKKVEDYISCIQLEAQISVLESLYIYFLQDE